MKKSILTILCALACLASGSTTIRVTPDASLAFAVRQAREMVRQGHADRVTIQLEPGIYHLTQPLRLRPEDSGLTIEGSGAVISGGVQITGWRRQGKLWVADVPRVNGRHLEFRQLWVNDRKAVRARDVQDFEQMHRILTYDKEHQMLWVPRRAVAKLLAPDAHTDGLEMVLHQMWEVAFLRVRSLLVDGDSVGVTFHEPEATVQFQHPWPAPMTPSTGHPSPFYLTNAPELLDTPGEWYLDADAHKLYYWPLKDEETGDFVATVPVLETLVEVVGSAEHPVRDITFSGVCFAHTTWQRPALQGHVPLQAGMAIVEAYKLRPQIDRPNNHKLDNQGWLARPEAAVKLSWAEGIDFAACRFDHLGGAGLDFVIGCKGGNVHDCDIADVALNGIQIGTFTPEGQETHLPYQPSDFREVCQRQTVSHCEISDVGNEDWGCVAIAAGCVSDFTADHNTIHDVPYTAISLGWGWVRDLACMKNNRIHANLIYRYAQHCYDCAGVYTLGNQPGTVISENVVRDIAHPSYVHDPNHWFYLYTDEGSSNITLRDNWCPEEKFMRNANGPGNVWENNGPQVADSIKAAAGDTPQ